MFSDLIVAEDVKKKCVCKGKWKKCNGLTKFGINMECRQGPGGEE